jgi:hypothetical protein
MLRLSFYCAAGAIIAAAAAIVGAAVVLSVGSTCICIHDSSVMQLSIQCLCMYRCSHV